MATLSYCFIGGYFLKPYVARFEESINSAASLFLDAHGDASSTIDSAPKTVKEKPYSLMKWHNVGYTGIMLFARDQSKILDLQQAEVGFGAADMGNKGAVGLRILYGDADEEEARTELTFVATHLAAMEWNIARRNANWAQIMRALTFENPEALLKDFRATEDSAPSSPVEADDESRRLLFNEHNDRHIRLEKKLHDISVFKPSSHLFLAGDLNYRISATSPTPDAPFPNLEPGHENHYSKFFPLDQLTREREAGRTMHGLSEAEVKFPPTYKYKPKQQADGSVKWEFATHRYPSWTDRVLYLETPAWLASPSPKIEIKAYNALDPIITSDHRPVYLRALVPLIPPEQMRPYIGASIAGGNDPRLRLPMEIDPEAWERRAAARRKEVATGWSMFLWSTQKGAVVLGTMVVAGLGAYWTWGNGLPVGQ